MSKSSTYRIGARGSTLAQRQAELIRAQLVALQPTWSWELVTVVARADHEPEAPLSAIAGEGIFVKELERALLADEIDLAVHSLKDVPLTGSPPELTITAIPERSSPYDALVCRKADGLATLSQRARIGSSSVRRQSQLLHQRPDLEMVPIRGNVDTRLKKLESDNLDAIVLAAAGLMRLDRESRITELLTGLVPEPGQGALAVQIRVADDELRNGIAQLDHQPTRVAVGTERAVLGALGGGCRIPIGAFATVQGDTLSVQAAVASPDGKRLIRHEVTGPVGAAPPLTHDIVTQLQCDGAADILKQ